MMAIFRSEPSVANQSLATERFSSVAIIFMLACLTQERVATTVNGRVVESLEDA